MTQKICDGFLCGSPRSRKQVYNKSEIFCSQLAGDLVAGLVSDQIDLVNLDNSAEVPVLILLTLKEVRPVNGANQSQ